MVQANVKVLGALVALALLLLVVSGLMGTNTKREDLQGAVGLPVYPGSRASDEYGMWATISGFSSEFSEFHSYAVEGSPDDVIGWYKSRFPDYTAESEETLNIQGKTVASLLLRKGNTVIGVIAFEQDGKTVYFVGKTTVPEEEGESLPASDVASGEEPLERYPGSVMLSYSKDGEFPVSYEIGYGTEDPHGKVAEWFKRTLKAKGWELTSQSGSSDTIHLVFRKDDDTVNIWTGTQPGAAYTVIDVSYTKRSLPDRDLVKGTDPLPRYPGAVMVGYNESSMNIQGFGSSAVKAVYLAPDKIDKVREWYLEMLRARFPNIYHDEGSIEAGSQEGQTVTMVHVDLEGHRKYTQVSVEYTTTRTS